MQINLLANTDLRAADEFENLIVAERDGGIVRLSDVARVELGAEEAGMIAKYNDQQSVYLGVWPLPGSNEIEVAAGAAQGNGAHRADAAERRGDAPGVGRHDVHAQCPRRRSRRRSARRC